MRGQRYLQREAQRRAPCQVTLRHGACQGPHPQQVTLALGHGDRIACIQQIEGVRGLEGHLVGRQGQVQSRQPPALRLAGVEPPEQGVHVGMLEVVSGHLHLVLVEHVAVGDPPLRAGGPGQVEDAVDALQVHGDTLQSVGDLPHDRGAVQAAHLLEIRELRDLHAIEPHLPAETPCAQGRGLPVVFHEADVVHQRVQAQGAQRVEVQLLKIGRRGFEYHLELIVVLQPVRILAVAPIRGAA